MFELSRITPRPDNTPTLLADSSIKMLKQMFDSKDKFKQHYQTLRVIRNLVGENVMRANNPKTHPQYPLFHTLNELMGCLFVPTKNNHDCMYDF